MQIGKNLQLPVAVLKVSHFLDDVTRGTVRRVNVLQMQIHVLYSGSNTHISSLVPCLNVGLLLDAVTREVIAINGFQVVSVTKRLSKKTSEGLHAHIRHGCPRDRRFSVVIATKRSSRTLLDSWPLEVCA